MKTPEFIPDRRRWRRFRVPVPVRELRPQPRVMRAANISAGGLYCPDVPSRSVGEQLLLEIDLGPNNVFVAPARVLESKDGLRLQFAAPQGLLGAALRKLRG